MRFLHFLDEKSDFSFPPVRDAIYIMQVKKPKTAGNQILLQIFPDEDPCSPITFQNLPSKHLFSHYCLHSSHPFVLFLDSESPDFSFPELSHLSLSCYLQGRLLNTWFQTQSTKKHLSTEKKVFGADGWTEKFPPASLSTASFHPTLCSAEATQVTIPICFPPSSTELQMLLLHTDTVFALLPTLSPPPSSGVLLNLSATCSSPLILVHRFSLLCQMNRSNAPAPLQHIFASAAHFHFRKSLRHCPWCLQPKDIIAFSSDATQGMSFGFRAIGSMASSWFGPSEAESAVQTHLLL